MGKNGEKLEKIVKSWEKWQKVEKKWLGVAICGFMWLKLLKVVLCGSKYVLPKR